MSRCAAIVLSAGVGSRMKSDIPKQYLMLGERPVIYYCLKAFEESSVDTIVLVTGAGDEEYCRTQIVQRYGLTKVQHIVAGGKERYDSVYEGLCALKEDAVDYVLIHDGARPVITQDIIARSIETVQKEKACVAGMPVKDTIKVADRSDYAISTPDRRTLWQVQTPQSFSYKCIMEAYRILQEKQRSNEILPAITDDAMLVEQMTAMKIKLIQGSYENIKITTPEDLLVAKLFLKKIEKLVDTV